MVVCGKVSGVGFLDELSTLGENTIAEFYQERGFTVSTTMPEQFPLQRAALADLLGGDKTANAKIVREILSGEERGSKREMSAWAPSTANGPLTSSLNSLSTGSLPPRPATPTSWPKQRREPNKRANRPWRASAPTTSSGLKPKPG